MSDIKEIVKQAVLRTDDECPCPFGLCIGEGACKLVGSLVTKMAPINVLGDESSDEEMEEIAEANKYLYKWQCPGTKCVYAEKIFQDNGEDHIVQCFFGEDKGLGDGNAIVGSPFYYNHFSGVGMDGLYSYPLGFYSEQPVDRTVGTYSLENPNASEDAKDKIIKSK